MNWLSNLYFSKTFYDLFKHFFWKIAKGKWLLASTLTDENISDSLRSIPKLFLLILEMVSLTGSITDYVFVSQGKTSIPGVDDGEELELTDVRHWSAAAVNFFFLVLPPPVIARFFSLRIVAWVFNPFYFDRSHTHKHLLTLAPEK